MTGIESLGELQLRIYLRKLRNYTFPDGGWLAGLTVIIMLLSPAGAWARLSLAIITLLPFPGSNRVQRKGLDNTWKKVIDLV